jgi:penicillin-binding protein 1A
MNTSNSLKRTIPQQINNVLLFRKPWLQKVTKAVWILFACFIIGFPLYIFSVSVNLFGLFGGMPNLAAIENPENDLSSEIISADGVSLGRYFTFNRSQVTYDELSPELVNTLLLSEDHRFHDHSGMDFWSYLRVAWGVMTFQRQGGGSTITQQLAKNLFSTRGDELNGPLAKGPLRILISKTKEWIISVKLESNFTKEEIITLYLNTSNFSSNAYGIKVAAETYFNKQPDSLNIQESAVLVGMLQAPSFYNPQRNPENSLRKRNEVLGKLFFYKYIKTREEYDSLKNLPIELKYNVQNQNEGLATYFRTVIREDLMKWCKENNYDLWESGLKIYTTIDSRMQLYAEEAMREHMAGLQATFEKEWKDRSRNPWVDEDTGAEIKGFLQKKIKRTDTYRNLVARYGADSDSVKIMLNLKKKMTIFTWKGERDTLFSSMDSLNYYNRFLQAGLMSMDPETGAIKAWVGGINHKYFKYDHVRQGTRQPGSTFKPFVYGTAIENGYTPCDQLLDISPTIKVPGGTWTPFNSDRTRGTGNKLTLRQAMAMSVNSISAQLIDRVKADNVVDFAHRAGIKSQLQAVPSICLGTSDVSLYEMVSAYCSFVNLGIHIEPYYITRIEDKNGNVIENFVPKPQQAMDEKTAYKMVYMLQGGVQEAQGTSRGLSYELKVDNEIGGKTGTTDNASDGWYMGVTHNLVTGAWVGGDERAIHFPSWDFGQGSKTARPIWDKYMVKVYRHPEVGVKKGYFKRPATGLDITLDCNQYTLSDSTVINPDDKPWDPNQQ